MEIYIHVLGILSRRISEHSISDMMVSRLGFTWKHINVRIAHCGSDVHGCNRPWCQVYKRIVSLPHFCCVTKLWCRDKQDLINQRRKSLLQTLMIYAQAKPYLPIFLRSARCSVWSTFKLVLPQRVRSSTSFRSRHKHCFYQPPRVPKKTRLCRSLLSR